MKGKIGKAIKMDGTKLWTKDFLIVSFVNFFVALNYYLLMIIISEYAMTRFEAPPSLAGLAAGIFIFGALVARLISGRCIGQIGQRKILYSGLAIGLVTTLLYFFVNGIPLLIVIRFLHGTSFGVASTATGTIVASIVPRERCGEGIGYYGMSTPLATAIGPFLGMYISQNADYSAIFMVCSIISAASILMAIFLSVKDVKLTNNQLEEMKGFKIGSFIEPKVISIAVTSLAVCFCYSSVISFLSVYAKEINLVDAAGFFYIVYAIVVLAARPLIGRLFDSKGENLIMYSAILSFAIGMVVFSNARFGWMLLTSAALIGFGFGAVQTGGQAIAVKSAEPHRMGLATSTYYMLCDIGMGAGPLIYGFIIPLAGYRRMYTGVAIALAACILLYYLLHGKKAACKGSLVKMA